MKKLAVLSVFAVFFFTVSANAANLYFYGGDFDSTNPNADALANETTGDVQGNPYGAATYQNFYVTGSSITTTSVFTNNLKDYTPTSGYWELRSGITEGNGGTLIASGTGAITDTATGRSGLGYTEYHNEVAASVTLAAGQYWVAVVPVCTTCSAVNSFNSNTFGINAVGKQDNNLQYFNSAFFGANFTNANNEGVFQTFSAGVYANAVPEPSSMIMLGSGLLAAAGVVRRRLL